MSVASAKRGYVHLTMIVLWRDARWIMAKEWDFSDPIYLPLPAVEPKRDGLGQMLVSIPKRLARQRGLA